MRLTRVSSLLKIKKCVFVLFLPCLSLSQPEYKLIQPEIVLDSKQDIGLNVRIVSLYASKACLYFSSGCWASLIYFGYTYASIALIMPSAIETITTFCLIGSCKEEGLWFRMLLFILFADLCSIPIGLFMANFILRAKLHIFISCIGIFTLSVLKKRIWNLNFKIFSEDNLLDFSCCIIYCFIFSIPTLMLIRGNTMYPLILSEAEAKISIIQLLSTLFWIVANYYTPTHANIVGIYEPMKELENAFDIPCKLEELEKRINSIGDDEHKHKALARIIERIIKGPVNKYSNNFVEYYFTELSPIYQSKIALQVAHFLEKPIEHTEIYDNEEVREITYQDLLKDQRKCENNFVELQMFALRCLPLFDNTGFSEKEVGFSKAFEVDDSSSPHHVLILKRDVDCSNVSNYLKFVSLKTGDKDPKPLIEAFADSIRDDEIQKLSADKDLLMKSDNLTEPDLLKLFNIYRIIKRSNEGVEILNKLIKSYAILKIKPNENTVRNIWFEFLVALVEKSWQNCFLVSISPQQMKIMQESGDSNVEIIGDQLLLTNLDFLVEFRVGKVPDLEERWHPCIAALSHIGRIFDDKVSENFYSILKESKNLDDLLSRLCNVYGTIFGKEHKNILIAFVCIYFYLLNNYKDKDLSTALNIECLDFIINLLAPENEEEFFRMNEIFNSLKDRIIELNFI